MKWTMLLLMGFLVSSQVVADSAEITQDPWEGFNRKVFIFNDTLDTYALKPVAKGYRAVTPDPVEDGISRMFSNLGEIVNVLNDVLQGKFGQAGNDTGRFLVNTTIGLVGFFDVADDLGLPKNEGEDFGQTLGVWGVGEGPFLMLPLFGPSTLRDGPARIVDQLVNPISEVDHVPTRNTIYGVDIISTRADLLKAEELVSGDKYSFIRDVYLQRREFLLNDGKVEDDFGSYSE
ncbi:MAG: VacJ family lipoprotein [Porticoccus sp.]|nr:VacJ family lipoprotein [Porticoccus sp.]